ncbi:TcmI family type II polyketide cyclase [Streptacidiphilus sp. 4-A2]|nr:TcmI family type II polyketide cyclase [Streptacidiphilus sp. 4-A2]
MTRLAAHVRRSLASAHKARRPAFTARSRGTPTVTSLDDHQAPPIAVETSRLRVVLLLDVLDGHQEQFLDAYEQIRHQVASVPGHVSDQLCQSLGNSSQWLITSEWESSEPFLEWVDSAAHRKLVEPLHSCVNDTRSLRFVIARETPDLSSAAKDPIRSAGRRQRTGASGEPREHGLDPLPAPPLTSGGVVRHAITFTVKPGSERTVAGLLADYRAPQARVDETTQLLRTSLFMCGNRVVRAVEVSGDLGNALRHVATQPGIRAVEEAINPFLEEARDLSDASSARAFFARAALPAVHHILADPATGPRGESIRHAFLYPVRANRGAAAASLLAELDNSAVADPQQPLTSSTVFLRDDVLVRVVDLRAGGALSRLLPA